MNEITFIGAGAVATKLSLELQRNGIAINLIWSKTEDSARKLANKLGCNFTNNLNLISKTDLIIICVKDDFLQEIIGILKHNNSPIIHTSGIIGIDFALVSSSFCW